MVSIIVVSHSYQLAQGIIELNNQMSPDADIYACGGQDDNTLGTSMDKLMEIIDRVPPENEILFLYDIGSSGMIIESAIDFCDINDRSMMCKAALVEGSLVACVSATLNKDLVAIKEDLAKLIIEK